jgi:hypothetical protein
METKTSIGGGEAETVGTVKLRKAKRRSVPAVIRILFICLLLMEGILLL